MRKEVMHKVIDGSINVFPVGVGGRWITIMIMTAICGRVRSIGRQIREREFCG